MEPWRIFFIVVLVQAASAAVLKDVSDDDSSFVSELSHSFSLTLAKSGSAVNSVLENRDADIEIPHTIEINEDKLKNNLKEEVVDQKKPVESVSRETIDPKPKDKIKAAAADKKPVEAPPSVDVPQEVPVDKQEQEVAADERPKEEPVQKVSEKPVAAQNEVAENKPPVEIKQEGTTSPNIIQQGIMSVQQTLSNISTGLTSIIRPSDSNDSSPPNILQSLQNTVSQGVENVGQTIQNIVSPRPSADENVETTAPPDNVFTQLLGSIQTTFNNIVSNGTLIVQNAFNGTNPSDSTNPFQQTFQAAQNTFNQGLDTIGSLITNATSGLQNSLQPPSDGPGNILQQAASTFANLTQSFLSRYNRTEQEPNFFQSFTSIFTGQSVSNNNRKETITEQFRVDVNALNDTLNEGIKNITNYWETSVMPKIKLNN